MAKRGKKKHHETKNYRHEEATSPMRPEVGTQASFRKKKPPTTYRYDSSLSPEMVWDESAAREEGEALIRRIIEAGSLEEAKKAAEELKAMSSPFLNWAGKAERGEFTVPTLPLFVHERLSTKAIIETLKGHKKDKQVEMVELFADPQHSINDQILRAYEHRDRWVNRMILGDSLTVMNSLLRYESLGGQVQMIYMDPPYGVNYRSNFQPFVRSRDVKDGDDDHFSREPEMVKAYRDTWELGLHSYLAYMRDRLLLARELLHPSGSVFVQIGDENVHHVRELMDDVFGADNFVALVNFKTMMPLESGNIESVVDYLCWYARDKERMKYHNLFVRKNVGKGSEFVFADEGSSGYRRLTSEEIDNFDDTAGQYRVFKRSDLASSGYTPSCTFPIEFEDTTFETKRGKSWRTNKEGIEKLKKANRFFVLGKKLYYKMYLSDFGYSSLINQWMDTIEFGGRSYVVQTTPTVIQRCLFMTTDPGDLVLDPTCGSGTTAYVAEQWGRRWITIDVSRVPLALARQRLLTATFPWYELRDEGRGPGSGFVYKRKQNTKGEDVGGIVPHITLKSIANDEPPTEEILVDRPEEMNSITRVTGPFVVEATIPTPVDWEGDGVEDGGVSAGHADFVNRMLEVLRLSPILHVGNGKTVQLKKVRPPAKTLNLSAEAVVDASSLKEHPSLEEVIDETSEKRGDRLPLSERPVAIVFGPENGAVSETLVHNAAMEANTKHYSHLYVIGFAIQPDARKYIEDCEKAADIPATYVQATPDLLMGDLLKNMRSSQIFSVCGLPEIRVRKAGGKDHKGELQVELLGLDVFDPTTMEVQHMAGDDVPAWFLDTDYNGTCFHVCQAFFPRQGAWDKIKKALQGQYEEGVWDHLAGAVSAPFEPGETGRIAVKVIDDRGNELMVVESVEGVSR